MSVVRTRFPFIDKFAVISNFITANTQIQNDSASLASAVVVVLIFLQKFGRLEKAHNIRDLGNLALFALQCKKHEKSS